MWIFFADLLRHFNFHQSDENNGILRGDFRTFIALSGSVLLRIRSNSDKSCRENTSYEIMWKNPFDRTRSHMTTRKWRMRLSSWVHKATKNMPTLCNTYCFSTATMVSRTLLSVTLHLAQTISYEVRLAFILLSFVVLVCTHE
jgi:hypothetical protein